MATVKITLGQTPVEIGTGEIFMSSTRDFNFAYSDVAPADLSTAHVSKELYTSGSFGKLWAWSASSKDIVAKVSKGV